MALKLAAGDFNKRVVIKKPTSIKNDEGGTDKTFTEEFTVWAAERSIDQKRVLESGGSALVDTRLLYVRYSPSRLVINKDWLINVDGIDFVIHGKPTVQDSGLKVFEIIAKAVHNG